MTIVGIAIVLGGVVWLYNIIVGNGAINFLSIIPPICLIFAGGWLIKTNNR